MLAAWQIAGVLWSYWLFTVTIEQVYFPNLSLKFTMNKTITTNFSQILRYQIVGFNALEMYEDGRFIYTYLGDSNHYQDVYFDKNNSESFYPDEVLVDFGNSLAFGSELNFLLQTGQILTFNAWSYVELDVLNLTEFQITRQSLLEVTNESFYIINPAGGNDTAIIWRKIRQDKINMTRILGIAQDKGRNLSLANSSSPDLNNSLDLNITETNESTVTAEDLGINLTLSFPTSIQGSNLNAKVCKMYFDIYDYLVLWNESAQMQMWKCDLWDCDLLWTKSHQFMNGSTIDVDWSFDCWKMYIKATDISVTLVYYAEEGWLLRNYTVQEEFVDFKPSGWFSQQSVFLYANGSFNYISSQANYTFLKQYNDFANVTQFSRYLLDGNRRIYINSEDYVQIWKFSCPQMKYYGYGRGLCYNCSWTCDGCEEWTGDCLKCIPGYEPNPSDSMSCRIKAPLIPPNSSPSSNSTHSNSTTPNSTQINSTQNQNIQNPQQNIQNPQQNIQNLTNINSSTSAIDIHPNHPLKYGAIYVYEMTIAEIALDGFGIIGSIIQFIFLTLQMAPLAWLFLNFMNFWNICSFYLFLNADIPQYLQMILKLIFQKINTELFTLEHLIQQIYPLQQKLPQLSAQYGISSSFLLMNLQSFLFIASSTILTAAAIIFFNNLNNHNYFKLRFGPLIDFKEIVTNQFISMTSNFFLPLTLITKNLNISTSHQLPNMLLHLFFIGLSLAFPFMIFARSIQVSKSLESKALSQKEIKANSKKSKRRIFLQKTKQWIYLSNCNTLVPFLCLLGIPQIFYVFGIGFFAAGIRLAWKSTQTFRINQIVLSLYPMVFHIFFILVAVFGRQSHSLRHHGSMVCTIVLFLGAIHELLALFFRVFIFLMAEIFKILKSTKPKEEENVEREVKVETIFENMKKTQINMEKNQKNITQRGQRWRKIKFRRKKIQFEDGLKMEQNKKLQTDKFQQKLSEQITLSKVRVKKQVQAIPASIFKLKKKKKSQNKCVEPGIPFEINFRKMTNKPGKERRKIRMRPQLKVSFMIKEQLKKTQNQENLVVVDM